jgi:hypothetical protein
MKNKQKGFVVPLLIGIIALLVVGGGMYVYYSTNNKPAQNSTVNTTDTTNQSVTTTQGKSATQMYVDNTAQQPAQSIPSTQPPKITKDVMTVGSILKAVGTKLGGKASLPVTFKINSNGTYSAVLLDSNGAPRTDSGYTIDNIFRGNLNQDIYEDAVIVATACGASCGTDITFIINNPGNPVVVPVTISNLQLSGATQVTIKNIVITNGKVAITINDPLTNSLKTYNYTFVNNQTNIELIPQ